MPVTRQELSDIVEEEKLKKANYEAGMYFLDEILSKINLSEDLSNFLESYQDFKYIIKKKFREINKKYLFTIKDFNEEIFIETIDKINKSCEFNVGEIIYNLLIPLREEDLKLAKELYEIHKTDYFLLQKEISDNQNEDEKEKLFNPQSISVELFSRGVLYYSIENILLLENIKRFDEEYFFNEFELIKPNKKVKKIEELKGDIFKRIAKILKPEMNIINQNKSKSLYLFEKLEVLYKLDIKKFEIFIEENLNKEKQIIKDFITIKKRNSSKDILLNLNRNKSNLEYLVYSLQEIEYENKYTFNLIKRILNEANNISDLIITTYKIKKIKDIKKRNKLYLLANENYFRNINNFREFIKENPKNIEILFIFQFRRAIYEQIIIHGDSKYIERIFSKKEIKEFAKEKIKLKKKEYIDILIESYKNNNIKNFRNKYLLEERLNTKKITKKILALERKINSFFTPQYDSLLQYIINHSSLTLPNSIDSAKESIRTIFKDEIDPELILFYLDKNKNVSLEEAINISRYNLKEMRIQEKLGQGISGETYKVRSAYIDGPRALKIIKNKINENESNIASRFKDAKHIPKVHHAGYGLVSKEEKEYYAILMEYIDGKTIKEIAESDLDQKIKANYARQLLEGIEELREKGVTHADLHPDNIKVNSEGILKILDFGLATTKKDVQKRYSRRYGAPEIANDYFSAGLIIYKLMTGEHLTGIKESTENAATIERENQNILNNRKVTGFYRKKIEQAELSDIIIENLEK